MCQVFAFSKRWRSSNSNKTFYSYVIFTYTVPFALVVSSVSSNLFRKNNVGYGIKVCFVEDTYSNLLTFVIPVAVSCISSLLLFLKTVGSIFCRTKVQKSKEDVSYVIISLKMFSFSQLLTPSSNYQLFPFSPRFWLPCKEFLFFLVSLHHDMFSLYFNLYLKDDWQATWLKLP